MTADAKDRKPPEIDNRHYPPHTKALMLLVGSLSLVLFWGTVFYTAKLVSWLLSFFGSYKPHVIAVLAVYLAVSFIRAWQPVKPLPFVPPVKKSDTNGLEPIQASGQGADVQEASRDNVGSSHASMTS